jgi:cytochrome c-type biogenesis protein CcmH/NrfG
VNLVDAACRRAHLLADVGRYPEAERIVRSALGQAPDSADLLILLGYLLRRQERYLDALAACDAAVALAPDRGDAHAQRAWTLIGMHRTGEATSSATEAVRLDPHRADRHTVLARALSDDDRFDEARDAAREALRLAPRSETALLTLADIERHAGNLQAAGVAVRQALTIDPTSTAGRHLLAMLDADRGVVRRSMRTLAGIAQDEPADPDLVSLVWPIRRVVVTPRWRLSGAAAAVAAAGLISGVAGRAAAALTCAVTVGFVLRTLVPAGVVPWRAVRLSPPLVRRWLGLGLATIVVALGLLGGYAAGGPVVLPLLVVAGGPVLWLCMLGEIVGHGLNDAGGRLFLQHWRIQIRDLYGELRRWPADTRRTLHDAWHAGDDQERERKQQAAALRQPLADYRNRARNTVLCAAFGVLAVLAGSVAVAGRPSTATTVGFGLIALLMLYTSLRVGVMRAVPTPQGLMLYGPLWTAILRWERVATVVTGDAHTTVSLIPVRAPVLILTDGRRFTIRQAAAYDLRTRTVPHPAHTWVDDVAAELEVIRLAYRPQPQPSSHD